MGFSDRLLYSLAKRWPSPVAKLHLDLGFEPGTHDYDMAYAQRQFDGKVRGGMGRPVTGLDVLEIGAGHGGISCFMAAVGARSVVGIDLNTKHLEIARTFAKQFAETTGHRLPVSFLEMNATKLAIDEGQFDLVLADNVFEHFDDPEAVMREASRVLRRSGGLLVPVFSSIYSKYGLHLKHGLKMPWANLVFSERTIVRAMQRLARDNPQVDEWYPGLAESPSRVRDLRRYKDLNDITYKKFKKMAERTGFKVERFAPEGTRAGKVLSRLVPGFRNSFLMDVLSTGASAYLRKA